MVNALGEALGRGQQALLFLNRRGHSTAVVCEACGQGVPCSRCDVSLTFHLRGRNLQCHYCGASRPVPDACPACGGPLLAVGAGTERIESEIGAVELTHVNLYDGTVEGIRALDVPAGCVQYHPEAGPGPNDSLGLFDEFIGAIRAA